MEKVRYETDPFNRLVIAGKGSALPRHRRAVDGVFNITKDNSLAYRVKSPIQDQAPAPYQTLLRGTWSLCDNHDLRFTLDRWKRSENSGSITISGEIVEVKQDSILFAVTTRFGDGCRKTYLLELTGSWSADKNNRLTFSVKREKGESDILTFGAAWDINKDNEIVYRYEKISRESGARRIHELCFKGCWRITDKARISYALKGASNSAFDFRASLGICGADHLKYEIGSGLSRHLKPIIRTLILYGTWRIRNGIGLIFETELAGGGIYSMVFGASVRITEHDSVFFKLRDPTGKKDLGLEIELGRDILEGAGSAFLRFLRSPEESALLIGGAVRW